MSALAAPTVVRAFPRFVCAVLPEPVVLRIYCCRRSNRHKGMMSDSGMNGIPVEVSVVLPCLNEESTIGACVAAASQALRDADIAGEVIVADNGSTDQSRRIAEAGGARVVEARFPGYGNALRAGLRAARGRYLVFLDADMSYDFADIPRFVEELRQGAGLVIGSRIKGGIDPGAMPMLHRWLGTPFLTHTANLLFGCRISDINCGMRALTREVFDRLDLHSEGMEFASEMMIKAALNNVRLREIPIRFHADQRDREPHLRSFRDGWRHLQLMMHYCSIWVFFIPGILLVLLGLLGIGMAPESPTTFLAVCLVAQAAVTLGVFILLLGLMAQGRVKVSKYAGQSDTLFIRFLRRWVNVESGVLVGALVALVGLAMLGWYARWLILDTPPSVDSAAPSNPFFAARNAFFGATALLAGLQVFCGSLYMGLFGIRVEKNITEKEDAPKRY